ncbi:MAG: dihydroorotate dehydrogenase (quinone), partial [Planctomycetota bacterium]
ELQNREPLEQLLRSLKDANIREVQRRRDAGESDVHAKPVLLKIAPDLTDGQLGDVIEILRGGVVDGIIATNTTISRDALQTTEGQLEKIGGGGLSGAPLTERSRDFVRTIYHRTEGQVPIIGVGGIMNGEHAWQMMTAGASLVQIYTGFVYGGPSTVNRINRTLLKRLEDEGRGSISEIVGLDA